MIRDYATKWWYLIHFNSSFYSLFRWIISICYTKTLNILLVNRLTLRENLAIEFFWRVIESFLRLIERYKIIGTNSKFPSNRSNIVNHLLSMCLCVEIRTNQLLECQTTMFRNFDYRYWITKCVIPFDRRPKERQRIRDIDWDPISPRTNDHPHPHPLPYFSL